MDIYKQRSFWNIALLIVGIIILIVTIVYSNYLSRELSSREEKMEGLFNKAQTWFAKNQDLEADATLPDEIISTYNLPVIYVDPDEKYTGYHWGERRDTTESFLKTKVDEYIKSGQEPIKGEGGAAGYLIYPFQSTLSTYIKYFPLVQFLLIGSFIALGYYLINTARKGEQNRVWAGMAKETAHQLGTPISAILAWLEFLKEANTDRPDQLEVIGELGKDVDRLELIADRFSKIGSDPELEKVNLYTLLADIETYMKRRSPRKVSFDFPDDSLQKDVQVNEHLFSWVLENLIRNALDAMDGHGIISAKVDVDSHWINIHMGDTGKGIPHSKHKEVFMPGYSTKSRGWGLGLSLAKRIIEDYHKGKIFVKSSKINEGTVFTIQLPLV